MLVSLDSFLFGAFLPFCCSLFAFLHVSLTLSGGLSVPQALNWFLFCSLPLCRDSPPTFLNLDPLSAEPQLPLSDPGLKCLCTQLAGPSPSAVSPGSIISCMHTSFLSPVAGTVPRCQLSPEPSHLPPTPSLPTTSTGRQSLLPGPATPGPPLPSCLPWFLSEEPQGGF